MCAYELVLPFLNRVLKYGNWIDIQLEIDEIERDIDRWIGNRRWMIIECGWNYGFLFYFN
jgi:hypothetical protein